MERVETAALGDSQTSKLHKLVLVDIRRVKIVDLERLKMVTHKDKLTQWPFLQSVLVIECIDFKIL